MSHGFSGGQAKSYRSLQFYFCLTGGQRLVLIIKIENDEASIERKCFFFASDREFINSQLSNSDP